MAIAILTSEFCGLAAPRFLLQDLAVQTWTKEKGLPDNSVTAVLQTRDGYLWVGTAGGLARFDGVNFVPFAPASAKSNVTVHVTALCEDTAGQLWIGTQGAGLLHYANGVVRRFERNADLSDQTISSIAEDAAGNLWAGTPSGLNRLEASRVIRLTTRDGLPSESVSSVHVARSGRIWITTSAGMCQYRDGQMLPLQFETDSAGRNPLYLGIYEDIQTNLWAYGGTYLVRLDEALGPGKRLNYFRSGDTPSVRLWSLCEGRDGQLWIGTSGQELYCFADNKLMQVTLRAGQLASDVRALFEDREGDLWLGTFGGGLVRLQPRSLRILDASVGLPPVPAVCLAFGPDERLWAGFDHHGLYSGSAERFEPLTTGGEPALQNQVSALCIAPDSALWAGTPGCGLYCLKGQQLLHYTTANGLFDNSVISLAAEADGTVWAGTSFGALHRFTKGVLTTVGPAEGLPPHPVSALLSTPGGGLWLGTTEGELLRRDGDAFKRLDENGFLAGKAVRALYADAHDRIWAGAADGRLACFASGAEFTWTATAALPDAITGILGDDRGDLWCATSKRIYHATAPEIVQWLSNRAPLRPELIFEAEPVRRVSSALGWPLAAVSSHGHMWFSTAVGVATLDPRGLDSDPSPPPVRIEAVLVNGQPLALPANAAMAAQKEASSRRTAGESPAALRLGSDLRSLEIQFTAFCFAAPEKLRFRHRLEPSDMEWVEDGPRRSVRYERLPYGNYKFRVTASKTSGAWSESAAEFAFFVPPPMWRAGWAVALYVICAVVLVAGAARVISHRRLRRHVARLAQEQAIQRERMRIAQDMHDEIGSKLTKISFMSERAKGDVEGQGAVAGRLDAIAHASRDLLQSFDELVWAVNPHNDNLEHLAAYLGQYVTEYLQNTAVESELHIPQGLPHHPVSAEVRHNLFLAFEEALNNALKHGRPSRVGVTMAAPGARFEVSVQDNGCGFEPVAEDRAGTAGKTPSIKHGGNGLLNMRKRLAEIGGQCLVRSQPGQGATITLTIPLNGADDASV